MIKKIKAYTAWLKEENCAASILASTGYVIISAFFLTWNVLDYVIEGTLYPTYIGLLLLSWTVLTVIGLQLFNKDSVWNKLQREGKKLGVPNSVPVGAAMIAVSFPIILYSGFVGDDTVARTGTVIQVVGLAFILIGAWSTISEHRQENLKKKGVKDDR